MECVSGQFSLYVWGYLRSCESFCDSVRGYTFTKCVRLRRFGDYVKLLFNGPLPEWRAWMVVDGWSRTEQPFIHTRSGAPTCNKWTFNLLEFLLRSHFDFFSLSLSSYPLCSGYRSDVHAWPDVWIGMDVKGGQGIQKKWTSSVCVLEKIYMATFDFNLFFESRVLEFNWSLSLFTMKVLSLWAKERDFEGGGGGLFIFD